jgi:hypothetical protein
MKPIPSYLAEFSGLTPHLSLSVSTFQSPFCSVLLGGVGELGSSMLSSCESIICGCVVRPSLMYHFLFLSCKVWYAIAVAIGMLSIATSNCKPCACFE